MNGILTGYFANTKRHTKVHLVLNSKPVCGASIKNLDFLLNASYPHYSYLECEKCKKYYSNNIAL